MDKNDSSALADFEKTVVAYGKVRIVPAKEIPTKPADLLKKDKDFILILLSKKRDTVELISILYYPLKNLERTKNVYICLGNREKFRLRPTNCPAYLCDDEVEERGGKRHCKSCGGKVWKKDSRDVLGNLISGFGRLHRANPMEKLLNSKLVVEKSGIFSLDHDKFRVVLTELIFKHFNVKGITVTGYISFLEAYLNRLINFVFVLLNEFPELFDIRRAIPIYWKNYSSDKENNGLLGYWQLPSIAGYIFTRLWTIASFYGFESNDRVGECKFFLANQLSTKTESFDSQKSNVDLYFDNVKKVIDNLPERKRKKLLADAASFFIPAYSFDSPLIFSSNTNILKKPIIPRGSFNLFIEQNCLDAARKNMPQTVFSNKEKKEIALDSRFGLFELGQLLR